ncbi:hypothetical protein A2U01_0079225, partial [Trifolium medium]|nr:hypothetical protein [Trifolium medium]
ESPVGCSATDLSRHFSPGEASIVRQG